MAGNKWTQDEDRVLLSGAGAFALAYFKNRVGPSYTYAGAPKRSRQALYARAQRLWGPGGFTRGAYSLRQLARESGYDIGALRRAQTALNHSYKRLTPTGPYLVSYDQREDLYAWLAHDFWAKQHRLYNCAWCHETARPHKGAGLCTRCYYAYRRLCRRAAVPHVPNEMRHKAVVELWDESVQRRLERGMAPPKELLAQIGRGV